MKKEYKAYWIVHNGNYLNDHPEYIRAVKTDIDPSFDVTRLTFGRGGVEKGWPSGVSVFVTGNKPIDLLLCAPYVEIISDRARRVIEEVSSHDMEFLPVDVFHTDGRKYVEMKYWAIYVRPVLDALDWENTVWIYPTPPAKDDPLAVMDIIMPGFREKAIENYHAFRYEVNGKVHAGWYVSGELKRKMVKEKCYMGIEFGPVRTNP